MLYACILIGFGMVYLGVAIMLAILFEKYHNEPKFYNTCGAITVLGFAFILISLVMFVAQFFS